MHIESFRRACVAVTSLSLLSLGMQAPAFAGIIGTADAVSATRQLDHRGTVQGVLARADVREQMLALGVDPDEVDGRIAALTDAEVALTQSEYNYAQAVFDYLSNRARIDQLVGTVPMPGGF